MAVCMGISGYFSLQIKQGDHSHSWVSLTLIKFVRLAFRGRAKIRISVLTGTVGVFVALRVYLDDRDADYSLDHDGGIVSHRNPRIRPRHKLLHSEPAHVLRAAKLQRPAKLSRRYVMSLDVLHWFLYHDILSSRGRSLVG